MQTTNKIIPNESTILQTDKSFREKAKKTLYLFTLLITFLIPVLSIVASFVIDAMENSYRSSVSDDIFKILPVIILIGIVLGVICGYFVKRSICEQADKFGAYVRTSFIGMGADGIEGNGFTAAQDSQNGRSTGIQNKNAINIQNSKWMLIAKSQTVGYSLKYSQIASVESSHNVIDGIDFGFVLKIKSVGGEYILYCLDQQSANEAKNVIAERLG